jgi:carbon-monoxide dehydrogenase small subunit
MDIVVNYKINNKEYKLFVKPTDILTDVLRDMVGLKSVKKGCETGDCGACSVIIDGKLVNSCTILAPTVDGSEILTVEGLKEDAELAILQKKFVELHGTQCGFCTPGMISAAKVLLDENNNPTEDEIRRALSGNLCRCTGYHNPVKAVKEAAKEMRGKE